MEAPWKPLVDRVNRFIWADDLHSLPTPRRILVETLRLFYVLIREFVGGDLNLRAMSLVYTTLLSLVPLLAVSFSVLKAFGVHNQIEPMLRGFLEPLGPKGDELTAQIIGFVEKMQVGVLGGVGLILLIYTVVALLQKIESAFNFVWHVDELRGIGRRLSNYLSAVMLGPVLVFSALGITASMMNASLVQRIAEVEPFGRILVETNKLLPYLLIWGTFTFIYSFVPNTRVRLIPAAVGGLVAGLVWQTTGWGFARFIATSTRYDAIYSSFAIIILLLIWLYLNWVILLIGAQISFYVQNPRYLTMTPVRMEMSGRLKERLTLSIMFWIGYQHVHERPALGLEEIADRLEVPTAPVHQLLGLLRSSGFVSPTAEEPPTYLPARDVGSISLADPLRTVRRAGESPFLGEAHVPWPEPVEGVAGRLADAVGGALSGATVRDLVLEQAPPSEKSLERNVVPS